jgi:hypothetical protein
MIQELQEAKQLKLDIKAQLRKLLLESGLVKRINKPVKVIANRIRRNVAVNGHCKGVLIIDFERIKTDGEYLRTELESTLKYKVPNFVKLSTPHRVKYITD